MTFAHSPGSPALERTLESRLRCELLRRPPGGVRIQGSIRKTSGAEGGTIWSEDLGLAIADFQQVASPPSLRSNGR